MKITNVGRIRRRLTKIQKNGDSMANPQLETDVLAAHTRTDVEQTPEGIQHDLDIMNDDKNWK